MIFYQTKRDKPATTLATPSSIIPSKSSIGTYYKERVDQVYLGKKTAEVKKLNHDEKCQGQQTYL